MEKGDVEEKLCKRTSEREVLLRGLTTLRLRYGLQTRVCLKLKVTSKTQTQPSIIDRSFLILSLAILPYTLYILYTMYLLYYICICI